MRAADRGSIVRVTVSRAEVESFKLMWPASGLPAGAIWFEFDRRNGDLVDLHPSSLDGPAALALSQDAQQFAGLA